MPIELADDDLFFAGEFVLVKDGKADGVLDEAHDRDEMRTGRRKVILDDLLLRYAVVDLADIVDVADVADVLYLRLEHDLGIAIELAEPARVAKLHFLASVDRHRVIRLEEHVFVEMRQAVELGRLGK